MPDNFRNCSLRSFLNGTMSDFVEHSQLQDFGNSSICQLISLIVDYREESIPLWVDVFLTSSIEQITELFPGHRLIRLGSDTCDEKGVKNALKKTAPLIIGNWMMFMATTTQGRFNYGVFRDSGFPLNVPFDLILEPGNIGDVRFIHIFKVASKAVQISNHLGEKIVIHFSNIADNEISQEDEIASLTNVITSQVVIEVQDECNKFLNKVLKKSIRKSHGTIVAVIRDYSIPDFFHSIALNDPLDIIQDIALVNQEREDSPRLIALEELINGIFGCDGIVIFNTKACLIAYHAFLDSGGSSSEGGARKRAFEKLCEHIGHEIVAAYYQSQDGQCEFRKEQ